MDTRRLQEELRKTRQELQLLYEIGNLIRTTLLLDEVVYLILSAVTSHEGLGYNRAMLFLVDENGTQLAGQMGIGPIRAEAAAPVWKTIEENRITLEGLLDVYHKSGKNIDPALNKIVRQIRMPIERAYGALPSAVIHDDSALIPAEEANHALADIRLLDLGIGQFAVVPLRGKDQVAGVLFVDNVTTKKEITHDDVRRLTMLANHAGLALENAKTYGDVMITSQQDSLTKLWNHGHFQRLLQESIREARAARETLSLIVFDVDDFKGYNDLFGHQAGDKALEVIAQVAKGVTRRADQLARYGGEEFAVVLPKTSKEEAVRLAERMREAVARETSDARIGTQRKITVSLGVASYPEDADEKEKLIFCADGALYEAKRGGKNKVRVYRRPAVEMSA